MSWSHDADGRPTWVPWIVGTPSANDVLTWTGTTWAPAAGGGGGAPTSATYVTLSTNGSLTNERVLTAGTGITVADAGAGSTVTVGMQTSGTIALGSASITTSGTFDGRDVSADGAVLDAIKAVAYVTVGNTSDLANERALTAGTGVSLTDGGAGSTMTVALASVANSTVLGNVSGGAAAPTALTGTQVTALLDAVTSGAKGLAPASGGGTANYLRADGTWAAPPGTGVTSVGATAPITSSGGTTPTIGVSTFSSVASGVVPASGGGTTNFLRADGTWNAPGGGADPWTYIKLGSDFVTSSATAVDVTGLAFTPASSTTYEIRGMFLTRTATATVGPRPGCAWPTGGVTDGVVMFRQTSAAGTVVLQNGNSNAAVLCPVGGIPNTTQSWPADMMATLVMTTGASGTFKVQLASETGGTNVTMKTGSWIAYRSI